MISATTTLTLIKTYLLEGLELKLIIKALRKSTTNRNYKYKDLLFYLSGLNCTHRLCFEEI